MEKTISGNYIINRNGNNTAVFINGEPLIKCEDSRIYTSARTLPPVMEPPSVVFISRGLTDAECEILHSLLDEYMAELALMSAKQMDTFNRIIDQYMEANKYGVIKDD